ncbi:MAG: YybH family protein [Acidobacteriota bacterium]
MRPRKFLPLMMFLITTIPCSAQTVSGSAKDEAAIREVLTQFEQAFEKRDARIYAMNFAEDADWENAFGSREKGRVNIEKRLTGVYQMFQQANQTIKEIRIRFVTPGVAVADVDREIAGQVSAAGDRNLPPRRVRTTHVFRKEKGKWQVVVFRVTDLRNPQEVQ